MLVLIKLGVSLLSILALAGLAKLLNLGGDLRIRDEDHARALAQEAVFGFVATDIVIDRAGMGALLKDAQGRQMLLRRHGAAFVGRMLDRRLEARLDQNFLTIGTGEKTFGSITLNLGDAAQYWAAGLRHVPA
jgi:hypothetical protein